MLSVIGSAACVAANRSRDRPSWSWSSATSGAGWHALRFALHMLVLPVAAAYYEVCLLLLSNTCTFEVYFLDFGGPHLCTTHATRFFKFHANFRDND